MFSSKLLDRFLPIETLMKNMSQIEVSNQEYISLCCEHPLTVGVELFKWYADQALLSKHFFHYKNIVKNITQELMQISEENFDVNVFTKIIEDAFKSQADADRNSFFSFWKTPADHRFLREDGHLKTIEDLIKTTIAHHATTQSKGLRIKG